MTVTDIDDTKHIRLRKRLCDTHRDFQFALDDYDGLPEQWEQIQKRFGDLVKAMRHAETCAGELPLPEQQYMARCLVEVVTPFVEYWRDVLESIDRSIDAIDDARLT
jgi:hypothetical protein